MKRVFVYGRVSTEEQSRPDHYSLGFQEDHARRYAKAQDGWRVAKCRKDVGSGKDDDRPAYQELLADIEAGAVDVVITYRLNRLSRGVRDIYSFLEKTSDAGIGFVSTSEHFDTTTAMGRAMLGVAAVFAQLTREMIGENVRDGLIRRAQSGKCTGATGGPRFGYGYSRDEDKLLVEAELFDEVQRLLEERKLMPPRTQHRPHLLSGIARCGKCGWRLVPHWQYHEVGGKRKGYRSYQHRANTKAGTGSLQGLHQERG